MSLQRAKETEETDISETPEHVHLYMPPRLRKRLKDHAKADRRSESQAGCLLIEERLDELEDQQEAVS